MKRLFTALLGLALWALALVSQMPELRYNEALLLLWPTDLVLGMLSTERRRSYVRVRVIALLVCGLGLITGVLRQPLGMVWLAAMIPFALMARAQLGARAEPASQA